MRFVIFFSVLFSVSLSLQYYVVHQLSHLFNFSYTWKIFPIFFLITVNFIAVMLLSRKIWNPGIQLWYFLTVLYIGSIWILGTLLFVYSGIAWVFHIPQTASQYVVIIGAALLIGYSLFNARQIAIRSISISSEKIAVPLKLVQLSDLHLGAIYGRAFVERIVTETNALKPDLIVITGDLFDGSGQISDDTLAAFDRFQAPAYLITGNHDKFLPAAEVNAMVRKTSLKLLQNESVLYKNSLQIIGLDYLSHHPQGEVKQIVDTLPLHNGYFTLMLSHVPISFSHLDGQPIDLLLAGHTHAGQIFPFYFVVKYFYPQIRGLYTSENRSQYVSSGTGTWGPPMRLGTTSEITLIQLAPQQEFVQK